MFPPALTQFQAISSPHHVYRLPTRNKQLFQLRRAGRTILRGPQNQRSALSARKEAFLAFFFLCVCECVRQLAAGCWCAQALLDACCQSQGADAPQSHALLPTGKVQNSDSVGTQSLQLQGFNSHTQNILLSTTDFLLPHCALLSCSPGTEWGFPVVSGHLKSLSPSLLHPKHNAICEETCPQNTAHLGAEPRVLTLRKHKGKLRHHSDLCLLWVHMNQSSQGFRAQLDSFHQAL